MVLNKSHADLRQDTWDLVHALSLPPGEWDKSQKLSSLPPRVSALFR